MANEKNTRRTRILFLTMKMMMKVVMMMVMMIVMMMVMMIGKMGLGCNLSLIEDLILFKSVVFPLWSGS